jgi:hypothetical protein
MTTTTLALAEYDCLDEATLETVLEIQLNDIQAEISHVRRKGKGKAGEPGVDYVLECQRDYLLSSATIIADNKFARSMQNALDQDAVILAEMFEQEAIAQQDRELAMRLSNQAEDSEESPSTNDQRGFGQGGHSVSRRTPGADPRLPLGYASGSGTVSQGSTTSLVRETECCACLEMSFCITAPCSDSYCHKCLKQVFQNACTDEELFPPRCCKKEIPLYLAAPFMATDEIQRFKAKKEEFTTRNRTYCFNTQCAAFIPTKNVENECALCEECAQLTCVSCKGEYHGGADCPKDTALEATLKLAAKKDWQRCKGCHALVERAFGCEHITW